MPNAPGARLCPRCYEEWLALWAGRTQGPREAFDVDTMNDDEQPYFWNR